MHFYAAALVTLLAATQVAAMPLAADSDATAVRIAKRTVAASTAAAAQPLVARAEVADEAADPADEEPEQVAPRLTTRRARKPKSVESGHPSFIV
ncbi:hypothetical protein GGTG_07126 [Gaeumannomyces tritici R3-111a-1]|uniref:Uncharacterized protein n=1 Tax=Gaeumannomyces tritici (strain R3-111a-1) TaxID=644352 RepID=J3P0T1_GAET3|nr:hypothetical protein GGTG_07126 [Gaeumannomyces tritici R3-111a-1]EJT77214.1 hypothetical protein GGTG_07126 [Gaeumannomyces tritici R3-111a-1]